MNHFISASQFTTVKHLENFFDVVDGWQNAAYHVQRRASGKVMASIFLEPSLRTRFSFESAMNRLGGSVITSTNSEELSLAKGESFEDMIRVLGELVDVIVLRSSHEASKAAKASVVPIINAGDGANEHPTQALLDMYTIRKKFNMDEELTVTFCGDLLYGRTTHSLSKLLGLYPNVRLNLVAPSQLQVSYGGKFSVSAGYRMFNKLEEVDLSKTDVLYMTRLQKERLDASLLDERGRFQASYFDWHNYCLTPELARKLRDNALILHPLPRNQEIPPELDFDPRCVYFNQQIKNGLKVRMALLYCVLTNKPCWEGLKDV